MTPEMKKRLDAAEARLAAIRAKAGIAPEAKSVTVGATSPETAADVARRIEVLERTVKSYESEHRERVAPAATTKAFTPQSTSLPSAEIGIDGKRFSLVKAAVAHHDFKRIGKKAWENNRAEYERDALEAYYAAVQAETGKTMTFGDEASGGFLVPPEIGKTIDPLRSSLFLDKLGVQKMPGLVGAPVMFPAQTSDATASWVSEGTATTPTNFATAQIRMNPHILTAGTRLSKMLMRHAPGTAESRARISLQSAMARKLERSAIEGGTSAGEPTGVANISGIGSVAFTSKDADEKINLIDQMILEVVQDDVDVSTGMWLMSEKVWANLMAIQIAMSSATATANLSPSVPMNSIAYVDFASKQKFCRGYPVVTTNNLTVSTTGELFFGTWNQLIVGGWGAMELVYTEEGETLVKARQGLLVGFEEWDIQAEHAQAFCKGTAYTVALSI
jgi:HK97 family phage major capsid protein